jgi:hypothetical protein
MTEMSVWVIWKLEDRKLFGIWLLEFQNWFEYEVSFS